MDIEDMYVLYNVYMYIYRTWSIDFQQIVDPIFYYFSEMPSKNNYYVI